MKEIQSKQHFVTAPKPLTRNIMVFVHRSCTRWSTLPCLHPGPLIETSALFG